MYYVYISLSLYIYIYIYIFSRPATACAGWCVFYAASDGEGLATRW